VRRAIEGQSASPVGRQNRKLDELEVAADPLVRDTGRQRLADQIRPVLSALPDVPPAEPGNGMGRGRGCPTRPLSSFTTQLPPADAAQRIARALQEGNQFSLSGRSTRVEER
jgi:hypothetical protein